MSQGPPDADPPSDRRGGLRYVTCYPFHIQKGEREQTEDMEVALIRDLSEGGAYLLLGAAVEVGARLKLHLDRAEAPVLVVEGRVQRTERRPTEVADVWQFGAAVVFQDPAPEVARAIRELAAGFSGG